MRLRFIVMFIISSLYFARGSDIDSTFCGTVQTEEVMGLTTLSNLSTTGDQQLAILFVDFIDGRVNGNPPTNLTELGQVDNLNAVGSLGYDWINPNNHSLGKKKVVRKYTYDHYWNKYFSTGQTWYGSAHPDYASHEEEAFGSFKEYYDEVSYGNLDIEPAQGVRSGTGMYNTGILNAIDEVGGKKYIRWELIHPTKTKSDYGSIEYMLNENFTSIINNIQGSTFDYSSFKDSGGRLIVVIAGSNVIDNNVAGVAYTPGNICVGREKKYSNTNSESTFEGLWIDVHEFGHNLGLGHGTFGTYDPMNTSYNANWGKHIHSPPHFNPYSKLEMNWIDSGDFQKIKTSQGYPIELSPSDANKDFASVTILGDAFLNNNYEHSDYYILEYRKREGFNRFSGGVELPPGSNFQGGILVWHHEALKDIKIKVISPGSGDPDDLFYFGNDEFNSNTTPNTSSHGVETGISMSDFYESGNVIDIYINYTHGAPTAYDDIFVGGIPTNPVSGKYLVFGSPNGNVTLEDNTHIEFYPGSIIKGTIHSVASSTGSISFRGAEAYGQRLRWYGIKLGGNSDIEKCLISDVLGSGYENGAIAFPYAPSGIEPTIRDNEFQNCTVDLSLRNHSESGYKELAGYDTNNFNTMVISGLWKLTEASTFEVPSGAVVSIENPDVDYLEIVSQGSGFSDYSSLQFKANSSLICRGQFNVTGNSNNKIEFTRNGSSGNWNYIKFYNSGGGTINNANIEYAKKGIYSQSDNVTVEDCIIEHFTEQGIYASYSDLTIEDCIIRNPDGASYGIYTFFSDPTISGTKIYDINGIGFYHFFNSSGTGTFSNGRIEDCSTGLKTYFSGLDIYNNYFEHNTYGIRTALNSDEVDIHDNDFIDNYWGIYTEQSGPNEIKWNQFGKSGGTYKTNREASILINSGSIDSNNSFLNGKHNNFYDGALWVGIDIDNNSNYQLKAEGNYWENYWYEGSVDVYPYDYHSNTNAGPGGSLGKLANGSDIADVEQKIPDEFKLEQNYPNPFNPSTTITFHLPKESKVDVVIYDMLGHAVRFLTHNSSFSAGTHNVIWNGSNDLGNGLASGIYIYMIKAVPKNGGDIFSESRKLVFIQ